MPLKATLFDFGGVLVRTRSQHLRAAWEEKLGLPPGRASAIVFGSDSSRNAQHGWITDAEHWRWIGETLALDALDLAAFQHDFFAEDILDTELLAYVDRLRAAGYHTGLLSNASDNARSIFIDRYGLASHFDSMTISAEEGVMKPHERIFRVALARAGACPSEAIFVDDFAENVDGARAIGMLGLHFSDPADACAELRRLTGVP